MQSTICNQHWWVKQCLAGCVLHVWSLVGLGSALEVGYFGGRCTHPKANQTADDDVCRILYKIVMWDVSYLRGGLEFSSVPILNVNNFEWFSCRLSMHHCKCGSECSWWHGSCPDSSTQKTCWSWTALFYLQTGVHCLVFLEEVWGSTWRRDLGSLAEINGGTNGVHRGDIRQMPLKGNSLNDHKDFHW